MATSHKGEGPKRARSVKSDPPKRDVKRGATTPSEFAAFEALTRKLVAVPKDEIDAARAKGSSPSR